MTNFPSSVANFLQLQDGVDYVLAQHPNDRGNEITAIETLLGAMGNTQAYTESYKNLLTHYRKGCQCIFDSTTALFVNAGEIVINDGSGNFRFRRNTTQLTVNNANLDVAGSLANSTTYYIYACADASGTTFTIKISTNATTPSATTFYRLIGRATTNGSAQFVAGIVLNLYDFPALGEWQAISGTTIYQAPTDGFVVGYFAIDNGDTLVVVSDGSVTPTTVRVEGSSASSTTAVTVPFMCPIRKGDYYEIYASAGGLGPDFAAFFIPINQ